MSGDTQLGVVLAELREAGVEPTVVRRSGRRARHVKVRWTSPADGEVHTLVIASTGGDHRGLLNARAAARRALRGEKP